MPSVNANAVVWRLLPQAEFNALRDQLKQQYHDRAALVFTYDEPLSHLIYAGARGHMRHAQRPWCLARPPSLAEWCATAVA